MEAMDSYELDQCLAVYAASAYVIADLSESLASRTTELPTDAPNGSSLKTSFVALPIVSMLIIFVKYA